MGLSMIGDYDISFHLATGKYITDTGTINHSIDPFSFTSTNPMSTTAWLADVISIRGRCVKEDVSNLE